MGTLHAALAWAERGFSVFPLRENTREPAYSSNWVDIATTDPDKIRALWRDPVLGVDYNYNIGTLCNNLVVVDIDVKNGKDGYNEYIQMGGSFDTLVVRTTSGGYHCYFKGPDSSNAPIAKSVDIRSHNGYVVAPGSTIDGNPYTVVSDVPMTWVPENINRLLKPVYVRTDAATINTELDGEASVQAGIRYLQSAPVAVEGLRGDEVTFVTAARLCREMALSASTAFALMRDHWNDRCSPPWDLNDLLRKVENAAQYGTANLGALTPEVLFGQVGNIVPPPTVFEQSGSDWGNAVLPERMAPRNWLVDRALMIGAVTLILAPGSAGKSSVSLALAAHLALGIDFAGYHTKRPCKTMVYNGEDDLAEQSRRLLAVCMSYNLDYHEVKKHIMLLSPREIKMDLVTKEFHKPQRNEVLVKHLTDKCANHEVGLLILDPLVKVHKCDESDNVQMDEVMGTLTDIAQDAQIAVLALHHTTKGSSRQEDRIGNMDIARGASAVVNAARIAYTLLNASQQDAEEYGFQDGERNMWVRLDDAKMNLALANTTATWFKKEGVKIMSQDVVGVMKFEQLSKSRQPLRLRMASVLIESLEHQGKGALTMPEAIAAIKSGEPLMANKTDKELREKMEGYFSTPMEIRGRTLSVMREEKNPDRAIVRLT